MTEPSILKSIDYMETHLFLKLTPEDCTRAAGYSVYHFCRLFHSVMDMTVMEYIRRRRLSEAAVQINETHHTLRHIAFSCGFNSQENFVRAFKNMFGILPTEYRKSRYTLLLFRPANTEHSSGSAPDFSDMAEPRILTLPEFRIAGIRNETTFKDSRHFQDVPQFWNRYYADRTFERLPHAQRVDYGVTLFQESTNDLYREDNTRANLACAYITGVKAPENSPLPPDFERVCLPARTYAVFENPRSTEYTLIENLKRTWQYIDFLWMPSSPYVHAGSFEFNRYRPDADRLSKQIYIPIVPK